MTRSRISIFLIGLALIVCVLVFPDQSPATVKLSDAEIARVIVGGPVTCDDDCACPDCWGEDCFPGGWVEYLGETCKDIDAWNFHEKCNCNGYGFEADYCHILTKLDCLENNLYRKNADQSCYVYLYSMQMPCASGGHTYHSSTVTQAYDECTETGSDPHDANE